LLLSFSTSNCTETSKRVMTWAGQVFLQQACLDGCVNRIAAGIGLDLNSRLRKARVRINEGLRTQLKAAKDNPLSMKFNHGP